MTIGRLGAVNLSASVNTILYTAPAGSFATLTINMCNRTLTSSKIRIAILSGALGSLSVNDYIEYDVAISTAGMIERSGIVVGPGNSVMVFSDSSNMSAVCWGFEEIL